MNNFDNGYWQVGDTKFTNKYQALLHSTRTHQQVRFFWHDEVWRNFDTRRLGSTPLKQLYKARAQQIRDKYDYVILMYSGGSDSWTVLNTFIENNIKLDCVCVRWNMNMVGTYTPNPLDTSAFNHRSEWDLVIQKDLLWLSQHHPNIKVEIADWFKDNKLHPMTDDYFTSVDIWQQAVNLHRCNAYPVSWYVNIDRGKRVGCIHGIDKPLIQHIGNGDVGMFFYDSLILSGAPPTGQTIGNGIELFYWSPDLPHLPFEQAYQLFVFYKNNPHLRYTIDNDFYVMMSKSPSGKDLIYDTYDLVMHLSRVVLYPDWDFTKFQAMKPRSPSREDKDFWFYTHPELQREVSIWRDKYQSMLGTIHPQLLDEGRGFKKHQTRFYKIGNYYD